MKLGYGVFKKTKKSTEPSTYKITPHQQNSPLPSLPQINKMLEAVIDSMGLENTEQAKRLRTLSPENKWQIIQQNKSLVESNSKNEDDDPNLYISAISNPEKINLEKLQNLRVNLSSKPVVWLRSFVQFGGLQAFSKLLTFYEMNKKYTEKDFKVMLEVCLSLRSLMNNSTGLEAVMSAPQFIRHIVALINVKHIKIQTIALELCACLVLLNSNGYASVIEAMHFNQHTYRYKTPYSALLKVLATDGMDYPEVAVWGLALINSLLSHPENIESRMTLRASLNEAGLDNIINIYGKIYSNNVDVTKQFNSYDYALKQDNEEYKKLKSLGLSGGLSSTWPVLLSRCATDPDLLEHIELTIRNYCVLATNEEPEKKRELFEKIYSISRSFVEKKDIPLNSVNIFGNKAIANSGLDQADDQDIRQQLIASRKERASLIQTVKRLRLELQDQAHDMNLAHEKIQELSSNQSFKVKNKNTLPNFPLSPEVRRKTLPDFPASPELKPSLKAEHKVNPLAAMLQEAGMAKPSRPVNPLAAMLKDAGKVPDGGAAPVPPRPVNPLAAMLQQAGKANGAAGAGVSASVAANIAAKSLAAPKIETPESALPKKSNDKPQNPRLKCHINKIPDAKVVGSMWEDLGKEDVEIDIELFDTLFAAKKVVNVTAPTSQSAGLLEPAVLQFLAIKCNSLKHIPDIVKVIEEGDDSQLEIIQIKALLEICTHPEQPLTTLSSFKGDINTLSRAEGICYKIAQIPHLQERVESWLFRRQFGGIFEEIYSIYKSVKNAMEVLIKSSKFKEFLKLVLSISNFMNAGSNLGGAYAFDITQLEKLLDTKANGSPRKLLHIILQTLNDEEYTLPDEEDFDWQASLNSIDMSTLNFIPELYLFNLAAKHSLVQNASDFSELQANFKKVKSYVHLFDDSQTSFGEKLNECITSAESDITSATSLANSCASLWKQVGSMYAIQVNNINDAESLINSLSRFHDICVAALRDNRAMREKEAKNISKNSVKIAEISSKISQSIPIAEVEQKAQPKKLNLLMLPPLPKQENIVDEEGLIDNLIGKIKNGETFKSIA